MFIYLAIYLFIYIFIYLFMYLLIYLFLFCYINIILFISALQQSFIRILYGHISFLAFRCFIKLLLWFRDVIGMF